MCKCADQWVCGLKKAGGEDLKNDCSIPDLSGKNIEQNNNNTFAQQHIY